MGNINLKIDNRDCFFPEGTTILEACEHMRILLPSLYYLKDVVCHDTSGICVVEIEGEDELAVASDYAVKEGIHVHTETPRVVEARVKALKDILAIHNKDCRHCRRTGNCELQELFRKYLVYEEREKEIKTEDIDGSLPYIVRDSSKCIRCGRCVTICQQIQGVHAIEMQGSGLSGRVVAQGGKGLSETNCVNCGQCVAVCPVGALYEKDDTDGIFRDINNPDKFVVAQVAPAVRAALGEMFKFPIGIDVESRIPAAIRSIGFDKAFDTEFGADLTIVEEATELIDRVKNDGVLPMITSCCPGWIKYCEQYYPEMLPHLSSCKSPHMMFGKVVKTYYAELLNKNSEDIVVVSIMPCTAKKFEISREEMDGVDYAITTREFSRMLKKAKVHFEALEKEDFDVPLGEGTGAAVIFGSTGGVMEAALRTARDWAPEAELKTTVVSGLENAKKLLEDIKSGKADYQFIEVMACPGGCVNGGGQPQQPVLAQDKRNLKEYRGAALKKNDENCVVRKSHENPAVIKLYKDYIGEYGGERAHELLHTTYHARELVKE